MPTAVAPSGGSGEVAAAQSEQAVAKASAQAQTSKANAAKSTLIPGG